MRILGGVVLLGVGLSAVPAEAQAVRLTCSFPQMVNETEHKAQRLGFELAYDTTTGDGFMVGNNGVSPARVVVGDLAISFIEELSSGTVQTTTVLLATGEAVHSRHTIAYDVTGGHSIFSQNYGVCTAG